MGLPAAFCNDSVGSKEHVPIAILAKCVETCFSITYNYGFESYLPLSMLLFPGVQDASGTYLVGGHLGDNQVKEASGAKIRYFHKRRGKSKDIIHITGSTNANLTAMVSNTRITETRI